jgi:L-2-hydroxyglutarate oxidase LhgO
VNADLDVVIIGGGVVGLAIAGEVAPAFPRVALLDRHAQLGQEVSSRSSEVVHAGLYYPSGTLKTRLCIEGRRLLYDLARQSGVAHARCGKIIVAVDDAEVGSLEALRSRGEANGVEGLRMLTAREVHAREPNVVARAALLSSETGIVDSHALVGALARRAREGGADLVTRGRVDGLERAGDCWRVRYADAGGPAVVTARAVVNAAGLGAQDVMRMAGLDPDALDLTLHLCKGDYFAVVGPRRHLVRGLVYPSPLADLVGLGIHTVVDLGGRLRLGPSAYYVDAVDYTVDEGHRDAFLDSVHPFLPDLEAGDLTVDQAGIRPKLAGPGEAARDFHIAHEANRGAPGFFNLAGIESPGLTASPAIARHVAAMIREHLA